MIVAATILHDIGKLRELEYHPVEAKYTKEGCLIGHVLMGRDLVRDAARKIEGFPEETLLLLEHAILAHHGKREFGAPIVPQTLEALLVSFVDDLDAKMNIAARERLTRTTDGEFTDKVFALDNRRFYKGIPAEEGLDEELEAASRTCPEEQAGNHFPIWRPVLGATGRRRPVHCDPATPALGRVSDERGRHWSGTTSGTQGIVGNIREVHPWPVPHERTDPPSGPYPHVDLKVRASP